MEEGTREGKAALKWHLWLQKCVLKLLSPSRERTRRK